MKSPNLSEEKKLWERGYRVVAGLDEAGRGSLAGPVVAAAVAIRPAGAGKEVQFKIENFKQLKDSKQLTPPQREKLYRVITKHPALNWGIGIVSEKMIDKVNILQATKRAMIKAVADLRKRVGKRRYHLFCDRKKDGIIGFLILDGKMRLNLPMPQKSIIKADEKVFSCAAASIIAKVSRDRLMERYDKKQPTYGFKKHKGYPTEFHLKMLKKYGPSGIHRKSFKPVKAAGRNCRPLLKRFNRYAMVEQNGRSKTTSHAIEKK